MNAIRSGVIKGCYSATSAVACVAWRFWLGALSNEGGRGKRNREEIGAEGTLRARISRLRHSCARLDKTAMLRRLHPLEGPCWCAKRLDRGEILKHPLQTDAVASSWLNQSRDDRKSKTRPRNKHQIIRRSKQSSVQTHRRNHEASVTSYIYEIRPKIRGPFDGW